MVCSGKLLQAGLHLGEVAPFSTHPSAKGMDGVDDLGYVLGFIEIHSLEQVCLLHTIVLTSRKEHANVLHLCCVRKIRQSFTTLDKWLCVHSGSRLKSTPNELVKRYTHGSMNGATSERELIMQ